MDIQIIHSKIHEVRGLQVILDRDLADMYGIENKRLKEQVRRNIERFPDDFMFELTSQEWINLRSQFATSSWGGSRYHPFAFTEQGVAMLSSVLNSKQAIGVNINIIRAFVVMRQFLQNNVTQLKEIEDLKSRVKLLEEYSNDTLKTINDLSEDTQNNFDDIYIALSELSERHKQINKPRNPIGFKANHQKIEN
ncbi:hypothetical protein FACS189464_4300 [Bacteroidia bacterium]|nr:hypothetical protein FACS189430_05260 [Bacteroidia bacterium]GHT79506.1 hypothetical protein FACS189464_4300 [Bacteroidia bacterium]